MIEPETGGPGSFRPVPRPERRVLEGAHVRLEPLEPSRHGLELFEAAQGEGSDPTLWDYMSVGPFADRASFLAWLDAMAPAADPLFFALLHRGSDRALGMASYMRITPEHGVIEIGNLWFGPALQRTSLATEAIFLLAHHVFEDLGYRRLEWKCNALNHRSRRAAERLGFTFEGLFRQHMIIKGRNRDTAWYSMLDREWPAIGAALRAWLAPANFDQQGRQRRTLESLRDPSAVP